ncbi:MAG: hypothetical protein IH840_12965 [Candidatus Heimdallarchaeota archaeon]|nr:hypothetical protein [Candidatus Heimdallarchaeota archaeon]
MYNYSQIRNYSKIILLLFSLLATFNSPAIVSGWVGQPHPTNPILYPPTHDLIFEEAVDLLHQDNRKPVGILFEYFMATMFTASTESEAPCYPVFGFTLCVDAADHYMDWLSHEGLPFIASAADEAMRGWGITQAIFNLGDYETAFYKFGGILHLIADMAEPHHTTLHPLNSHSEFEGYASSGFRDDNIINAVSVTESGIYKIDQNDPLCNHNNTGHCSPYEFWGWLDWTAHHSATYLNYVDGGSPDSDRDIAINYLLPLAVKVTAGLMNDIFYKVIQAKTPTGATSVHYPYQLGSWTFSTSYTDVYEWIQIDDATMGNLDPATAPMNYQIDWGDGTVEIVSGVSDQELIRSHIFLSVGLKQVKFRATFGPVAANEWTPWSTAYNVNVQNFDPTVPLKPSGPTKVQMYHTRGWWFSATHPGGSVPLLLEIDWGRNVVTGLNDYQQINMIAGQDIGVSHRYDFPTDPTYLDVRIKARVSDDNGLTWTSWSPYLEVKIVTGSPPPGGCSNCGPM